MKRGETNYGGDKKVIFEKNAWGFPVGYSNKLGTAKGGEKEDGMETWVAKLLVANHDF
ncbi:MAG: hypothetical protein NZ805_13950 [Armatimonadetes bacterium]|nr:hypothetical protein [Armatimonadota bacterium]MDW8029675.1 hypothetical protein [Armatimonadota bacterium]